MITTRQRPTSPERRAERRATRSCAVANGPRRTSKTPVEAVAFEKPRVLAEITVFLLYRYGSGTSRSQQRARNRALVTMCSKKRSNSRENATAPVLPGMKAEAQNRLPCATAAICNVVRRDCGHLPASCGSTARLPILSRVATRRGRSGIGGDRPGAAFDAGVRNRSTLTAHALDGHAVVADGPSGVFGGVGQAADSQRTRP